MFAPLKRDSTSFVKAPTPILSDRYVAWNLECSVIRPRSSPGVQMVLQDRQENKIYSIPLYSYRIEELYTVHIANYIVGFKNNSVCNDGQCYR